MGDLDVHGFDRGDHPCRRRCAGGHHRYGVLEGGGVWRVGQCIEYHRGAAKMADSVLANQGDDLYRVDLAQEYVGARLGRDGPWVAPAVAVKHRQGPQIHRVVGHAPGHLIAQRIEKSTSVVVDHALGVTGCAGGVVEGYRVPLIKWPGPDEVGVTLGEQGFVFQVGYRLALEVLRVADVDQQRWVVQLRHCGAHHIGEFPVHQHHPRLAVLKHVGDGIGIEADVEGIEHRADHRYAKVRFKHRRDIGQDGRHGVAAADTPGRQCRGQLPASGIGLRPCTAQ